MDGAIVLKNSATEQIDRESFAASSSMLSQRLKLEYYVGWGRISLQVQCVIYYNRNCNILNGKVVGLRNCCLIISHVHHSQSLRTAPALPLLKNFLIFRNDHDHHPIPTDFH